MSNNRYSIGIVLIAIAVVLLLGKLGVFHFIGWLLWPLLVGGVALLLHLLFFWRMAPSGVLIPGGMLATYAVLFLFCNLFGWHWMSLLWPLFPFGVAVGLYEFQLFDRYAPRNTMTAALVIAIVSAGLFAMMLLFKLGVYIIAIALLIAGAVMLARRSRPW